MIRWLTIWPDYKALDEEEMSMLMEEGKPTLLLLYNNKIMKLRFMNL